jgi:hypothetical protein
MRRRSPKRLRRRAGAAPFLRFVRSLNCCSCGRPAPSEASHVTISANQKGTGTKVSDAQVVPHCRACHRAWEERRGPFAGWSRDDRYEQARAWVAAVQLLATPETYEQAIEFERFGLGTVLPEVGGAWSWWPATGGPMPWRAA